MPGEALAAGPANRYLEQWNRPHRPRLVHRNMLNEPNLGFPMFSISVTLNPFKLKIYMQRQYSLSSRSLNFELIKRNLSDYGNTSNSRNSMFPDFAWLASLHQEPVKSLACGPPIGT